MKNRKIVALLLSAAMVMSLTGCSKDKKAIKEASEELGATIIDFDARDIVKMYDDIDDEDEYTIYSFESLMGNEAVELIFDGAEVSVTDIEAGKDEGSSTIVITVKDFTDLDPDDFDDMDDFIDAIEDLEETIDYSFEVEWIIDGDEVLIDDCDLIDFLEDFFEDLHDVTPSFYSDMVTNINFWNDSGEEGIYTSNPSWIDLDVSMSDDFGEHYVYFTVSDNSGVIFTSGDEYENDYIECYWYANAMGWDEIPSGEYTFSVYVTDDNSLICTSTATVR